MNTTLENIVQFTLLFIGGALIVAILWSLRPAVISPEQHILNAKATIQSAEYFLRLTATPVPAIGW